VLLAWLALWSSSCQTTPATNSAKAPNTHTSQLAKDLVGTWVLVDNEMPAYIVRLKFFTGRYWTITEADPVTGLTSMHHGGTYTLDGDKYTENVEYANPSTSNLINQTFQFTIKIDGDTLTQTGIGNPWTETWKRAIPERTMAASKSVTVQVRDSTGTPLTNVTVVCVDGSKRGSRGHRHQRRLSHAPNRRPRAVHVHCTAYKSLLHSLDRRWLRTRTKSLPFQ